MVDVFSKQKRSDIMRRIGPKDTKPELFVRRLIHSMGYRFRLHRKDLPGTPDLVFPKYKKVIFVNGCFWHGHENCRRSKLPSTNAEFWEVKIERNVKKDRENMLKLHNLGWDVLTIWQCEVGRRNIEALEAKIKLFFDAK